MQYKYICLIFLFFSLFFCAAQTENKTTVMGKVLDRSGNPIPFSNIIVNGFSLGAVSDSYGNYTIKNVPLGNHKITASIIGYSSQIKEVTTEQGKTLISNFFFKAETCTLEEAVIYGKSKSQKIRESALTVNTINIKDIANVTADLNQIVNRTTGVRVREQGGMGSDFNFSINGLSGNAVKFFIDGIPMESMGSLMTLNNIPSNLAKRVDIYKGVVPVELGGDALGGAVNVVTNQSISNYLDASYSYGSFNSHKVSLTGQAKNKKTGLVFKARGFYNASDNNYIMRDIEVFDEVQRNYVKKELERFHDDYMSAMGQIEVGVYDKKWADIFFVGGSYTVQNKEIQTGAIQSIVYGQAKKEGNTFNTTLKYKKDDILIKNLNLGIFASYVKENSLEVKAGNPPEFLVKVYIYDHPSSGIVLRSRFSRPDEGAVVKLGDEGIPMLTKDYETPEEAEETLFGLIDLLFEEGFVRFSLQN